MPLDRVTGQPLIHPHPRCRGRGGRLRICWTVSEIRQYKLRPERAPTRRARGAAGFGRRHLRMQIDGAEERRGRDDPEQGRPVFDEAPGAAERVGGESRRIPNKHDYLLDIAFTFSSKKRDTRFFRSAGGWRAKLHHRV